MNLQDDPAQIAEQVEQILAGDEFRYDPSLFERFSDWIGRQLERLFGDTEVEVPVGAGSQFAGGIGSILAWLIILVLLAGLVAVVVYVVRNHVRKPQRDSADTSETSIEHDRPADEWDRDAARFEAEHQWKDALKARYRQMIRILVDRRQLPDVPGRTTGELRSDLAVTTPAATEPFDRASFAFELGWYAHVPIGEGDYGAFRREVSIVLAAPMRSSVDYSPDGDTAEAGVVEVNV